MAQTRNLTGKILNEVWGVGAKQARYGVKGEWYDQLTKFPGAFFDANGYIVFRTEHEYRTCSNLHIVQQVNIPESISAIPGYVRISERNQLQLFSQKIMETTRQEQKCNVQARPCDTPISLETPKAVDFPDEQNEVNEVLAQIHRIIRDTAISRRVKHVHGYKCQICGETIKLSTDEFYAEAHHIKPLGKKHGGPDVIENIMCVCPNHHVQLDYGAIRIDMTKVRLVNGHDIREMYVEYHNNIICGKKTSQNANLFTKDNPERQETRE